MSWFRPRDLIRRLGGWLRPSQRSRWTRAGLGYLAIWLALIGIGLFQQINLLLLTAGLAAGPIVASVVISSMMLRKVVVARRAPDYLFAGSPLVLDYTLENHRWLTAALALEVFDELGPSGQGASDQDPISTSMLFERVPPGERQRLRWRGPSPKRGRYAFQRLEVMTRAPFGLLERREILPEPGTLLVYPTVGRLARRWHQFHRESTEAIRGRRHDRSAQQQEYQGLRDYRPGDTVRWIHWRTTARRGQPMVKEFEQQSDQDLAILLDPWRPPRNALPEQEEAIEAAIRFVATVCLETCRQSGRRLLLGWTGATPGLRQGPASVKLLHELLERLAVLPGTDQGRLSDLFDAMPMALLREARIVVVSTRPIRLADEAARSQRLVESSLRGFASRVQLLDASRGDLDDLIEFDAPTTPTLDGSPTLDGQASRPAIPASHETKVMEGQR